MRALLLRHFRERAEERLRDHILKFEKKLEDLQKDVDLFRRKDVNEIITFSPVLQIRFFHFRF
jgi:hypothetical protein